MDGVSSEPFSGSNSLLTGKNTGKFVNFAQKSASGVLYDTEYKRVPATQSRFLSSTEQGIIARVSGNIISLIPAFRTFPDHF